MNPSKLEQVRNEPEIRAIHAVAPYPQITTVGDAMTGALQGPVGTIYQQRKAASLGGQLAQQYGVQDPTFVLQKHFVTTVSTELGLKDIESVLTAETGETARNVSLIQKTYHTGLMFVFETWMIHYMYHMFSPTKYWLTYWGKGSLYQLEDSQKLWSAMCEVKGDSENSATLDQLRANNGALLKKQLGVSAHACADQLVDDFLGKDE